MIHWCPLETNSLDWYQKQNLENMFNNINFIISLSYCKYLITTSNYLKKYLSKKIYELKLKNKIDIYAIKHPIEYNGNEYFEFQKFKKNKNKKIIQIGQQYRKISSVYKIKTDYSKIWLTGNKDLDLSNEILNRWLKYTNEEINIKDVKIKI